MPQPNSCPNPIYEIMLKTWDAQAEKRPTFIFLCDFFDNYFAGATEANYKQANAAPKTTSVVDGIHDNNNNGAREEEEEDAEIANFAPRSGAGFAGPHQPSLQHNHFDFQRRTDTVVVLAKKSASTAQDTPMAVI